MYVRLFPASLRIYLLPCNSAVTPPTGSDSTHERDPEGDDDNFGFEKMFEWMDAEEIKKLYVPKTPS